MSIINALKYGFQQSWHYRRVAGILYLLVLICALWAALPFKSILEKTIGHSLIIGELAKGFDFTFWADYVSAHTGFVSSFMDHSLLTIAFFILLMTFVAGGITATVQKYNAAYDSQYFWGKSGQFFWRMLRLSFYFLLVHICVLGGFVWLFFSITKGMDPQALDSEVIIFTTLRYLPLLYIPVAALFMLWQDYSKHFLVQQEPKWIYQSMKSAFQFIRQNFRKTYGFYLLNMGLIGLLFGLNYLIAGMVDPDTGTTIFLSFLITQFFIFARLAMKLVNMGSAWAMIQNHR